MDTEMNQQERTIHGVSNSTGHPLGPRPMAQPYRDRGEGLAHSAPYNSSASTVDPRAGMCSAWGWMEANDMPAQQLYRDAVLPEAEFTYTFLEPCRARHCTGRSNRPHFLSDLPVFLGCIVEFLPFWPLATAQLTSQPGLKCVFQD